MLFPWIQRRFNLTNRQENVDRIYAFDGKAKQLQKYQENCFLFVDLSKSKSEKIFVKRAAFRGPVRENSELSGNQPQSLFSSWTSKLRHAILCKHGKRTIIKEQYFNLTSVYMKSFP